MTHHLGYAKHDCLGQGSGNSRNGASSKRLKSDFGEVAIEVPRDRNGSFEPKIVANRQRRFTGFDEKTLSMGLRKIIKTRGAFPSEEAGLKLLFLALRNVVEKWETVQHRKAALRSFMRLPPRLTQTVKTQHAVR